MYAIKFKCYAKQKVIFHNEVMAEAGFLLMHFTVRFITFLSTVAAKTYPPPTLTWRGHTN